MKLGFIAKLVLSTIGLAVVTAAFLYFTKEQEQYWFWAALVFYFLIGLIIGVRTQKAVVSESNSQFFTGVMGGTGIRMLLSIIFLAIYLISSQVKSTQMIIYFLFLYLFFTIFEIYQLIHRLRAEKQSKVDNATP
jgi:hypothetical protein